MMPEAAARCRRIALANTSAKQIPIVMVAADALRRPRRRSGASGRQPDRIDPGQHRAGCQAPRTDAPPL